MVYVNKIGRKLDEKKKCNKKQAVNSVFKCSY